MDVVPEAVVKRMSTSITGRFTTSVDRITRFREVEFTPGSTETDKDSIEAGKDKPACVQAPVSATEALSTLRSSAVSPLNGMET